MRLTVGPLPPAVYWRRRALVLGAILLVLFLVTQACLAASADPDQRPSAAERSATPAASPPVTAGPATSTGTPSGAGDDDVDDADDEDSDEDGDEDDERGADAGDSGLSGPDVCTDGEMLVTAVAEETAFPAGADVQFEIEIRNDSDRACRRDVGSGQRELYLRQGTGATKIWSSRDCVDLRGEDPRELPPGFTTSAWVVWNGEASDDCDGDRPAGGTVAAGEYELVARLGTAYSEPVSLTVTD